MRNLSRPKPGFKAHLTTRLSPNTWEPRFNFGLRCLLVGSEVLVLALGLKSNERPVSPQFRKPKILAINEAAVPRNRYQESGKNRACQYLLVGRKVFLLLNHKSVPNKKPEILFTYLRLTVHVQIDHLPLYHLILTVSRILYRKICYRLLS